MFVDTTGQRNLFALLCADGSEQLNLGQVSLHGQHFATSRSRTNVDHQNFVLSQLGDLRLLVALGLDTQKTAQQEKVDFDFNVNIRQLANSTEHLTDQSETDHTLDHRSRIQNIG